jgi:hypothetical protein
MSVSFAPALLDDLLAQVFRGSAAPTITGPFLVSLHTGNPGTTRANEVTAGVWSNYARQSIARSTAAWEAPAADGNGRRTRNAAVADFGTATIPGAAPVITHLEVWDSSGTPRRIIGRPLASPKTINNGDPVSVPLQNITATLTPDV